MRRSEEWFHAVSVVGLVCLGGLAACGQNANLTRKSLEPVIALAEAPLVADSAPAEKENEEIVVGTEPTMELLDLEQAPEVAPLELEVSSDETPVTEARVDLDQSAAVIESAPIASPSPEPVPSPSIVMSNGVINGLDGRDGADGKDGRNDCGVRSFTVTSPVIRWTNAERKYPPELPYRPSSNHPMPRLHLGEMTGVTRAGAMPYVLDSIVLFKVQVPKLPPIEAITRLDGVLKLEVSKVSHDHFAQTELLCLVGTSNGTVPKFCSGNLFSASNWQVNIQRPFFDSFEGEKPGNAYFAEQYLGREITGPGGTTVYASSLALELPRLIEGHSDVTLEALLGTERALQFVVSDDTFVREGELVIQYEADTCMLMEGAQP